MYRRDHQYRGRVEILRDFLGAVRAHERKTRIIGLANLNPTSFQRYLDFSLSLDLVRRSPKGYRLTPRAEAVLDSIDRLLAKSAEVDVTLRDFQRAFSRSQAIGPGPKPAFRYISRIAWDEVCRTTAESEVVHYLLSRPEVATADDPPAAWLEAPDPDDPPGPAARALDPGSSRRRQRSRSPE
jgi:predicted transcriptional regulator